VPLHAVLHSLSTVTHLAEVPVNPAHDRLAAVPDFAGDRVGAHRRALIVIKGGAFNTPPANAAASYRAALPDLRSVVFNTGFRCVRPLAH